MEQDVLVTKMIGIVVAVIVAAVVLVPICNSLAEGDGGSGGGGSGGGGDDGSGVEIPNYSWSGPMEIMSDDIGFSAMTMAQAESRFTSVQVTPQRIEGEDIVDDSPITVKNGKCVIKFNDTSNNMVGTIEYMLMPTTGFRSGMVWVLDAQRESDYISGLCTDWSVNAQGKITFTVDETTYQDIQASYLGVTASDDEGWNGCDIWSDLYKQGVSIGFNLGDYIGIAIEKDVTYEGSEGYARGVWFGQVSEPVFTVKCEVYSYEDDSLLGETDFEIDLTEYQHGSAFITDADLPFGSVIAYPESYYVNATKVSGFKYDVSGYVPSISNESHFKSKEGLRVINVGGESHYVTSSIAKLGTDKYVWENGGIVNKGPSTSSDFYLITQEGYGIGTKEGIYVEVEDIDDEIGLLHISSGSLSKASVKAVSPFTFIQYPLGESQNMASQGYFAEFNVGSGDWYVLSFSQSGVRIKLPVQNVSSSDVGGLLLADKDARHYTIRMSTFGQQSSMQTEDYNQSWGDFDTYLDTNAIPSTLDLRYVDFNDLSDEPLESGESGEGSSSDSGSDLGVAGTIIGIIPVFVILAILMGAVGLFYQGRKTI